MYQKEDDILTLDADVICLAETAATKSVQVAFNEAIKHTPYKVIWTLPIFDKFLKHNTPTSCSFRGEALGAAIMTKHPHRSFSDTLNPATEQSRRVVSSVVSCGSIDILFIAVYFQAGKTAETKVVNNHLLQEVYVHAMGTNMPFIVAGDFNIEIHRLEAFPCFMALGCVELFQYHRRVFGFDLPPTCKEATRNDTMLIHPLLVPYIRRIQVGDQFLFADHRPVLVDFDFPIHAVPEQQWFVPKSWSLFPLDKAILERNFRHRESQTPIDLDDISDASPADSLRLWSQRIEQSVDDTIRYMHRTDAFRYPTKSLPRQFRGRCQKPKMIPITIPKGSKHDITEAYNPPCESTSVRSRQKIRQVRRLRCLQRLCQKHGHQESHIDLSSHPSDLLPLWQAIRLAPGYGRSWERWILQFDVITTVHINSVTWNDLDNMLQITKFDSDLYCRQEHKLRMASNKHLAKLDQTHKSGAKPYKSLKADENKILPGFPIMHECLATLRRSPKGEVHIQIHSPIQFKLYAKLMFGTAELILLAQEACHLRASLISGVCPTQDMVRQHTFVYRATDMTEPFRAYWSQYWNRDSEEEELGDSAWQDTIDQLTARIPPTEVLPIVWDQSDIISQTISKLKPYKAPGIDGWRAEELRLLPPSAVISLAKVLSRIWHQGLGKDHMIARVVLLAKRNPPETIGDGRPITILGYLSRLTSKIIADQLLRYWGQRWPAAIAGGLPNRGVKDISFMQQFRLETCKKHNQAWMGFTLDLVKAFNLLPRRVIYHLLVYHGAPPSAIKFWFLNLTRMTRRLQVRSAIGEPITMTTGVPEGDSLSVCSMLVLSSAYYWLIRSPNLDPFCYADNWSYLTSSQRENYQAFTRIRQLALNLRLQIDYQKSWAWGTTKVAREKWQETLQDVMENPDDVRILNSAKDLGCMCHYTKQVVLGHLKEKFLSAATRCKRLTHVATDLPQKASLIQTAIWPHAFFGAESQLVGENHFKELRRAATTALVGPEQQASSWLAMQFLSLRLQDPLLYVICTALSFLRRMFTHHPETAQLFLEAVCTHTGNPHGPAGALACYLHRVQWKITSDGLVICPSQIRISVKHDTPGAIRKWLRRAWDDVVYDRIRHRKGVTNVPFHADLFHKVLHKLTPTEIKILAKDITGGYQVGAVKAQWSSTTDGNCPYCQKLDTHSHRQLQCPDFEQVRNTHPSAIQILRANPYMLHFPLPLQHESVSRLRSLLCQRGQVPCVATIETTTRSIFLYTDGSADTPSVTEFQRAAWSVIQYNPDCNLVPFRTVLVQHVHGRQTISRAELAAIAWIVRECYIAAIPDQVIITTDSQYAINVIRHVTQTPQIVIPPHMAHSDLLQDIQAHWIPNQFIIRKIKSHQMLCHAKNGVEEIDISGNDFADRAAVCARKTDHPDHHNLFATVEAWNQSQLYQTLCVLRYLHDLNLAHIQRKEQAKVSDDHNQNDAPNQNWGNIHQARAHHQVIQPLVISPPDIHPHVFTACLWGADYAKLVLQFFLSLRWPDPDGTHDAVTKSGITWHELAIAFILQTGLQFPCWIKPPNRSRARPHHFLDPKVLALPSKLRSLREQADAIRIIIQYLQGFCHTRLYPKFHKTASSSLVQVGWGRTYTGGFPLRPQFANSEATQKTLQQYAQDLGIKPPFHPLGLVPMQLSQVVLKADAVINLDYSQCYHFRKKLREVWNKGGDLDALTPPAPPN